MMEYKFRYRFQHKKTKEIKTLYYTLPQIENGIWQHSKWDETLGMVPGVYEREWILLTRDLFTGRKDKNDKEIYEGDIVKYKCIGTNDVDYINKIIWKNGCLIIENEDAPPVTDDVLSNFEVIGNIYKNPELLK